MPFLPWFKKVRETVTIPLVFMTYLNPVYVYGAEKFFARCQALNIRGIIVPDMPYEEKVKLKMWRLRRGLP